MSTIFGILGVNDTDRVFVSTIGQSAVYAAITELLNRWNDEIAEMKAVFVERQTEDFKVRWKLPGTGMMQEIGEHAPGGAVKHYGEYDVAFPLKGYGEQVGGDRVALGYMTLNELDRHIDTVLTRDLDRVRYEILHRLLDNVEEDFWDKFHGELTIKPLANGDTVTYPPVITSTTEATDDHYLVSGYTVANISDTNDPFQTGRDELLEHYGWEQGGSNVICFTDDTVVDSARANMTNNWTAISDMGIAPGAATATLINMPSNIPGRIVGRASGVWVSEWRRMPDGYMLFIHLDQPKPLYERIDPADTGLGSGLQLVAEWEEYPLSSSHWEHRYGFGVANRLNGVVMEVTTDATYTVPTAYD